MTKYATVDVWMLIDEDGDYVASDDAGTLNEKYEEKVQDVSEAEGLRRVKISVRVPLPTVLEASAELVEDTEAVASAA